LKSILNFLENNRQTILNEWEKYIIDNYPVDAGKFLLGNKNQFANPIGYTIRTELPIIFDAIINDNFDDKFNTSLENFIRIRAVQNYSVEQANSFCSFLQNIIENYAKENQNPEIFDEFLILNKRLQKVLHKSFECYLSMKQKLMEIKLDEVKRQNQKMIERLNKKYWYENDN